MLEESEIKTLSIQKLRNDDEIPYDLLLLADPSIELIKKYIHKSEKYILLQNGSIIGFIAVLDLIKNERAEIKNIAITEKLQGNGYGKFLLESIIKIYQEKSYKTLIIGTGNSSIAQLALYQKIGFEIESIDKGFFLRLYNEAIIENGIICKDMIYLSKTVNE